MKEKFMIKIETWHKPDMGEQDNVSHTKMTIYCTLNRYITGIIAYNIEKLDLQVRNNVW